jgi:GT2 family glycosyltransferase
MTQASHQLVAIVILTWNNPDDTLDCLRTVTALDCSALTTIVVDNGSTDDSVARIRAAHPAVELIETGENLGYAGGNNVGIRHALDAGADAICILNNDVIRQHWPTRCMNFSATRRGAGNSASGLTSG